MGGIPEEGRGEWNTSRDCLHLSSNDLLHSRIVNATEERLQQGHAARNEVYKYGNEMDVNGFSIRYRIVIAFQGADLNLKGNFERAYVAASDSSSVFKYNRRHRASERART